MGISRTRALKLLRGGRAGVMEWNTRRERGVPSLAETDLAGADLAEANLAEVDLRGANLSRADLRGADLRDARLDGANLHECNVAGSKWSRAGLAAAKLDQTILDGITVHVADSDTDALAFEQLKLFQDYTKWHVGLYAGSTVASLALTELTKNRLILIPLILFVAAAACAGTLLGNISRFRTERELDRGKMSWLWFNRGNGAQFRLLEKLFFWSAVISLVALVYTAKSSEQPLLRVEITNAKEAPSAPPKK